MAFNYISCGRKKQTEVLWHLKDKVIFLALVHQSLYWNKTLLVCTVPKHSCLFLLQNLQLNEQSKRKADFRPIFKADLAYISSIRVNDTCWLCNSLTWPSQRPYGKQKTHNCPEALQLNLDECKQIRRKFLDGKAREENAASFRCGATCGGWME